MTPLLQASLAAILYPFWLFVAWAGGPTHPSNLHARWRLWQCSARLRQFVREGR